MDKINKYFVVFFLSISFVLANYNYLTQPPILLNNPFYSVYKSIINFTLKLPMSSFAKADIFSKAMEENLYNLGFALEINKNFQERQDLIVDFRKYGFGLRDLVKRWQGFVNEENVLDKLKRIQLNIFRFTLALKYEPLSNLTQNEINSLRQILQSLSDEIYNLLGPQETFNNLQDFDLSIDELIYLLTNLFANKSEVLKLFSDISDIKNIESLNQDNILENLENFQKLINNVLPEESSLRFILLDIVSSTKKLNDLTKLIDQNKAYVKDLEKFGEILEKIKEKLQLTKEQIFAEDYQESLKNLMEINNLLEQASDLIITVDEDLPVIKPELLPESSHRQILEETLEE